MNKPTHVWIGRTDCGCVLTICVDSNNPTERKKAIKFVSDGGLIPERVTWDHYKTVICNDPGFMKCTHETKSSNEQPSLFEVKP